MTTTVRDAELGLVRVTTRLTQEASLILEEATLARYRMEARRTPYGTVLSDLLVRHREELLSGNGVHPPITHKRKRKRKVKPA